MKEGPSFGLSAWAYRAAFPGQEGRRRSRFGGRSGTGFWNRLLEPALDPSKPRWPLSAPPSHIGDWGKTVIGKTDSVYV